MAGKKRLKRSEEMDLALFDILASEPPVKDSGPDPFDIIDIPPEKNAAGCGLAADMPLHEGESGDEAGEDGFSCALVLDARELEKLEKIRSIVLAARGDYIGMEDALRLALEMCRLKERDILEAHAGKTRRSEEKQPPGHGNKAGK
jgi:hypothetical protein